MPSPDLGGSTGGALKNHRRKQASCIHLSISHQFYAHTTMQPAFDSDGGLLSPTVRALNAKINKLMIALSVMAILVLVLLGVSIYAASAASSAQNDINALKSGGSTAAASSDSSSSSLILSTSTQAPDGYRFIGPIFQGSGYWAEAPPLPVPSLTDHAVLSGGTSAYLIGGAVPNNDTEVSEYIKKRNFFRNYLFCFVIIPLFLWILAVFIIHQHHVFYSL